MAKKVHGLRGSALEQMINLSNAHYQDKGLALIQKVPTPITPITIDKESRHITLAYFDQKSTVDYIGAVQGIPVCFDAKECAYDTFSLQNVHPHQVQFMGEFEKQDGVAFLIIHYTHLDEIYYMPYRHLLVFWERACSGGRKSFRYEEIDKSYRIVQHDGILIPYLDMMQKDLEERDDSEGHRENPC